MEQEIASVTDSLIRLGREFGLPVVLPTIAVCLAAWLWSLHIKNRICRHCNKHYKADKE